MAFNPVKYFSQSFIMYCIASGFVVGICILSLILSGLQMEYLNQGFGNGWKKSCDNKNVFQYLSPFRFELNNGDLQQCPWPEANTVYRMNIGCIGIIVPIIYSVLFWRDAVNGWFLIAVMKTTVIVLTGCYYGAFMIDCDHTRIGFNYCEGFLTNFYNNLDTCYLDPWIYTILCDFGCFLFFLFYYFVTVDRCNLVIGNVPKQTRRQQSSNNKRKNNNNKETTNDNNGEDEPNIPKQQTTTEVTYKDEPNTGNDNKNPFGDDEQTTGNNYNNPYEDNDNDDVAPSGGGGTGAYGDTSWMNE